MERLPPAVRALLADKKLALCLLCGLLGGLILLFSGGSDKTDGADQARLADVWRAEARLEARAKRLLSEVKGVGSARVTVTLDNLSSTVYLRNTVKNAGEESERSEYVLVSGSGGRDGLARCVLAPEVRGVAVCCRGGADPRVRKEAVALLCAAFGIPPNRVYITAMK